MKTDGSHKIKKLGNSNQMALGKSMEGESSEELTNNDQSTDKILQTNESKPLPKDSEDKEKKNFKALIWHELKVTIFSFLYLGIQLRLMPFTSMCS
jgi:hypothetical protein